MLEVCPMQCQYMICDPSTRRLGAMIKRQFSNRLPINYPEAFHQHFLHVSLFDSCNALPRSHVQSHSQVIMNGLTSMTPSTSGEGGETAVVVPALPEAVVELIDFEGDYRGD